MATRKKGYMVVDEKGRLEYSPLESTARLAKAAVTDLATPGTQEADWKYWEGKGYRVARVEVTVKS